MLMIEKLSLRRRILAVLCGGFLGTLARYFLSMLVQGWSGKGWPYDILLINLTGALLLALVSTLADETFLVGPTQRLFINTGFMGAYTTFSSLALGDVLLFSKGALFPALLYLVLSLLGGPGMVLLGDRVGKMLVQRFRRSRPGAVSSPVTHIDIQDDILLPAEVSEIEPQSR
jgi:fluoride exporter